MWLWLCFLSDSDSDRETESGTAFVYAHATHSRAHLGVVVVRAEIRHLRVPADDGVHSGPPRPPIHGFAWLAEQALEQAAATTRCKHDAEGKTEQHGGARRVVKLLRVQREVELGRDAHELGAGGATAADRRARSRHDELQREVLGVQRKGTTQLGAQRVPAEGGLARAPLSRLAIRLQRAGALFHRTVGRSALWGRPLLDGLDARPLVAAPTRVAPEAAPLQREVHVASQLRPPCHQSQALEPSPHPRPCGEFAPTGAHVLRPAAVAQPPATPAIAHTRVEIASIQHIPRRGDEPGTGFEVIGSTEEDERVRRTHTEACIAAVSRPADLHRNVGWGRAVAGANESIRTARGRLGAHKVSLRASIVAAAECVLAVAAPVGRVIGRTSDERGRDAFGRRLGRNGKRELARRQHGPQGATATAGALLCRERLQVALACVALTSRESSGGLARGSVCTNLQVRRGCALSGTGGGCAVQ
eukprot:scaffold8033_cov114-Isochrysis_galbana.AAC.5